MFCLSPREASCEYRFTVHVQLSMYCVVKFVTRTVSYSYVLQHFECTTMLRTCFVFALVSTASQDRGVS